MEALRYDTTYYVKIVAKDTDGSAAASAAGSAQLLAASGPDIRAGSIVASHIAALSITTIELAAEAVTAEKIMAGTITANEIAAQTITASEIAAGAITSTKLESTLVLSTKIVAGTEGAARLEMGDATGGTGLFAYSTDGTTVKFSVNADTGDVYAAGRVDFGTGSRLDTDFIDIKEQGSATYQTPNVVQTRTEVDSTAAMSMSWASPTTYGNECLMIVSLWDTDGTSPTPTTPSGWALVTSLTSANIGTFIYRSTTSASRSGTETISFGGDTTLVSMRLMELSGVEIAAADRTAIATGTSSTPASGSTAATTQSDEMLLGIVAWDATLWDGVQTEELTSVSPTDFTFTGSNSTGIVSGAHGILQWVFWKNVTATGAYSFGGTFHASTKWIAATVALKAKANTLEAPAADKLRIYVVDDGHAVNDASTLVMQNELGIQKSLEYPGLRKFHDAVAPPFFYVHSDFSDVGVAILNGAPCGEGVILSSSGTGAGVGVMPALAAHPGILRMATGTTTSGRCEVASGSDAHIVGNGRMRLGALVRMATLSDGTDTFHAGVGFKNFAGSWGNIGPSGDCIILRYSHGNNSGKWQAATSAGGSAQTADTGVTVNAGSWYWLEIDVAADGSSAKFYVNGSLLATLTSGATFPTGALSHMIGINKGAGTTSRNFDCDFYYCYVETGVRS